MGAEFCQRLFSASIEIIVWFLSFSLLSHWCITNGVSHWLICIWKNPSAQFSHSVVSNSLQPHESLHARPPCPSPTPGVHSNSHPLSQWCHPAISSSVVHFSSCPQSLPASIFSNKSTLRMRWQMYWSFSFSIIPSKEIPGLISFGLNWVLKWVWKRKGKKIQKEGVLRAKAKRWENQDNFRSHSPTAL